MKFHPTFGGRIYRVELTRQLQFLPAGKTDLLRQIRDLLLDLPGGAFQGLPPLIREGTVPIQRLVDAAVDLRQLLLGKKGAGREEAGPDGEVPFGAFVAVAEARRAIIVPLSQRSSVMRPIPGDELDTEMGLMPR